MPSRNPLRFWAQAAMIGATYFLLTAALAPISYGIIQVRISEALSVLPYFTPAAIPGLFVGCFLANLAGGNGILDVIFGSLATLVSAYVVSKIKPRHLVPLPPVLINAVVVGLVLHYVLGFADVPGFPLYVTMAAVGAGQLAACYGLGYPLILLLERHRQIFK